MNIGINVLYLIPSKVGGTETYARELIPALGKKLKEGDQIIIFAGEETAKMFPKLLNIKVISMPIKSSNRFLRILAEQFLLPFYCMHYHVDILFSLGYSAPFFHSFKSIVTIHDLNWYYHPEDFNPINRLIWEYVTRLSAATSNHVVTDSAFSANSIIKILKISPKKVTPILHGVPDKIHLSKQQAHKTLAKLKIKKPYIFTVVAGYPHKNLKTLLHVFAKLVLEFPALSLIVSGLSGKADSVNSHLIKSLKLSRKVQIVGYVNRVDLAAIYQSAEIFVFPSAYEGFGYPPIEAMSYGVPVVSSNASSLPEVVGDGGFLVNTYNDKEYVRSIRAILDNALKRKTLITKGKKRISELSWLKTAKLMYNLCVEV